MIHEMLVALLQHVARIPSGLAAVLPVAVWVACSVISGLRAGEIHANGTYACRRDENPFGYWLIVAVYAAAVIGFVYALAAFA